MSGTSIGGKKAAKTNLARHGKDFYVNIGRKGGKVSTPTGGFGYGDNGSKFGRKGGKIGGRIGKRNYTIIDRTPELIIYQHNKTKELLEVEQ